MNKPAERPAPLTQSYCDLRDFQFMPLDVGRLRDSDLAANETPEACWAAVLLWSASWHQVPAASIPNDEKWIAKTAGYALRGRIDKDWAKIRAGALHRWIECSDGRLYHPVVAEKANEAWQGKLRQRWNSECARIKKHNQRHPDAEKPIPTFEEWLSSYCPEGQSASVPKDKADGPEDFPGDSGSKGQGEGQGQGQGYIFSSTEEADASSSEEPPARGGADLPADQSDEDLFWSLAKECDAKGIARSRLGKLLKLAHAGATTIPAATRLVQSCLKAKDPSTYFGATIRQIEEDAGIIRAKQMKAGKKVPPWVAEWREAGETVTPIGPNQWSSRGKIYDDEGRVTGW